MVAKKSLKSQLNNLGLHFRVFGRAESKELQKILRVGENIHQCAHGYYLGGSGLLVVTDQRILLIDKRTLYLNLEEFLYSSIQSVDLSVRALQASLTIRCLDKQIVFRSLSDARLRNMRMFIKEAARRFIADNDMKEDNLNIENARPTVVWRPNNAALVPRLRPTKFYGSNLSGQ
jgi:Bacterial PH domain